MIASLLTVQINHSGVRSAPISASGVLGMAIMFGGLALAMYGAMPIIRFHLWRARARSAQGIVVENAPCRSQHSTSWLPVVEFQADGQTVMALLSAADHPKGWPLGSQLDVLYNAADPHDAALANANVRVPGTFIGGLAIVGIYLAAVA